MLLYFFIISPQQDFKYELQNIKNNKTMTWLEIALPIFVIDQINQDLHKRGINESIFI